MAQQRGFRDFDALKKMPINPYPTTLFGHFRAAPKPRAEGSSPSAPANEALKTLRFRGFLFLLRPKMLDDI